MVGVGTSRRISHVRFWIACSQPSRSRRKQCTPSSNVRFLCRAELDRWERIYRSGPELICSRRRGTRRRPRPLLRELRTRQNPPLFRPVDPTIPMQTFAECPTERLSTRSIMPLARATPAELATTSIEADCGKQSRLSMHRIPATKRAGYKPTQPSIGIS